MGINMRDVRCCGCCNYVRGVNLAEKEIKNRPIGIDDRERDFLGVPAGGGGCCLIIWFAAIAIGVFIYFEFLDWFGWFS